MFNIHPDELVYSACARFSDKVQYCSYRDVADDLFGDPSVLIQPEFPSGLAALASRLPRRYGYSADHLIDGHTLVPFYAAFMRPERLATLRSAMTTTPGPRRTKAPVLFAKQACPSRFLRYCPTCLEEDRRQYGEGYWHRGHQLPGIEICPDHDTWLIPSGIPIRASSVRKQLITLERALNLPAEQPAAFPHEYRLLCLSVAREATWLLRHPIQESHPTALRDRYIRLLAERGWATFNGRIREGSLLQAFYQHFPNNILEYYRFPITLAQQANPLLRLLRSRGRPQHPLHHILLLQFLGVPVDVFSQLPSEAAPFGSAPWPCLNPAAAHFLEHVVTRCHVIIARHEGHPIGTFACQCGFVYQRAGPDPGPIAKFTMDRVLPPSTHEHPRLETKGWGQLHPANEASSEATITDPGRSLLQPSPRLYDTSLNQRRRDREIQEKRQCWLKIIEESRDPRLPAAKTRAPQLYRWLYEHDRAWLLKHRPAYRARRIGERPDRSEEQDAAAVRAILIAIHVLTNVPGKPIWRSRTVILREARLRAEFPDDLRRVPKAAALLTTLTESRNQFIDRRLVWAVNQLRSEGRLPTRRLLILRTGFSFELLHHPAVDHALQEAWIGDEQSSG